MLNEPMTVRPEPVEGHVRGSTGSPRTAGMPVKLEI
jgi:hypothetical protein